MRVGRARGRCCSDNNTIDPDPEQTRSQLRWKGCKPTSPHLPDTTPLQQSLHRVYQQARSRSIAHHHLHLSRTHITVLIRKPARPGSRTRIGVGRPIAHAVSVAAGPRSKTQILGPPGPDLSRLRVPLHATNPAQQPSRRAHPRNVTRGGRPAGPLLPRPCAHQRATRAANRARCPSG